MFTIKWIQANGCVTLQESQAVGVLRRGTELYKLTANPETGLELNQELYQAIISKADGSTIPIANNETVYIINSNGKTVETVYKQS